MCDLQRWKRWSCIIKHFTIGGIIEIKYSLTKGKPGSKIFYIAEYIPEKETPPSVKINLRAAPRLRKLEEFINFKEVALRGRSSGGIQVTKHSIKNVVRNSKT